VIFRPAPTALHLAMKPNASGLIEAVRSEILSSDTSIDTLLGTLARRALIWRTRTVRMMRNTQNRSPARATRMP
jgi:hypothetical protein